jgi:hypothetical protein
MTPYERNSSIHQFYYDHFIQDKNSQNPLTSTSVTRYKYIVDQPLPYVVKRVIIGEDKIETIAFEPIHYQYTIIKQTQFLKVLFTFKTFPQSRIFFKTT